MHELLFVALFREERVSYYSLREKYQKRETVPFVAGEQIDD